MTYHRSPVRLAVIFAIGAIAFVASQFAGSLTMSGGFAFGIAIAALIRRTTVTIDAEHLQLARIVTHRTFPAGGATMQAGRGVLGSAVYLREPGRVRQTVDLALYSRNDQRAIRSAMSAMFKVGQVV
jgi:hypothetical protein